MPVRLATRRDIPIMAQVLAASFGPDPLFQHMFPHREQYPQDFMRALRENLLLSWWDYQKVLTVSYEVRSDNGRGGTNERQKLLHAGGREEITGLAEWERVGKGWQEVHGIWGWWDPRLIVKPVLSTFFTIRRKLLGNKASRQPGLEDPDPLTLWNFIPKIIPYVLPFFDAPHRRVHWSLEILGVDPAHHGKGFGKELVQDGLTRINACPDDLPVAVISADGKETFYQKMGFKELVGWVSKTKGPDGSDNPLRANGVGGGAVLWTR